MAKKASPAAAKPLRGAPHPKASTAPAPAGRSSFIDPKDLGLGALLFCATFLAYGPALNGQILWDDKGYVTYPALQSLHGLWRIWFDVGSTEQYYPLLHSAFWIEHRLWGNASLGYHLANVVQHVAAAFLLVAVVRRLALPGAWLCGFVFALHPICVESVAWISEQKNTLSMVFYLAAAWVYLDFDRTRRKPQYFLATGLFVLALLSKTLTATLPAALLVVFWWKRGRLDWKRDVLPLVPWLAIGAVIGLFSAWVERNYIGAKGHEFTLTRIERILVAGRAIWFYLGKFVWPANLMFQYPRWHVSSSVWWQYLFPVGVGVLTGVLLAAARRHRGPLAAFLFFVGSLFPTMGFFNLYAFRYSFVDDHFQYLPDLGLIVLVAAGLMQTAGKLGPVLRRSVFALLGALFLTCGVLTARQSAMYRDAETLYRTMLARNPGSWMAHDNLGNLLIGTPGHVNEAVAEYEAAVQLNPNAVEVHNNLGIALMQIPGRATDAITEYKTAIRMDPGYAEAYSNLGNAYMRIPGHASDAIAAYQAALRIKPDFVGARTDLGFLLASIPGRLPEAIAQYEAALQTDPNYADAHNNLGCALASEPGRMAEAIDHFRDAIRINPHYAEAHRNLGIALSTVPGRMAEAVAELEEALRIDPDVPAAREKLNQLRAGQTGQ
jgi:tetratricopeptide (TPR) repeat protein